MKTKLLNYWEIIRSSYWFVPGLMTAFAFLLANLTVSIDRASLSAGPEIQNWFYTGGVEGVRTLMSTLAGSMMTMVSVTFSITIVALTMASSQFGPRLLNNFMRDTGNQLVLGTFIATFIYSVLVLRTVRGDGQTVFVPHISVTTALALTVVSLALFIFFIHHVSTSINVQNVIASVEKDLNRAIERLFPDKKTYYVFEYELREEDDVPEDFNETAQPVPSRRSGYLQTVDNDGLMKLAEENDLLMRLEHRPGSFVATGSPLVRVWPEEKSRQEDLADKVNDAFNLGAQRLQLQDVEFAVDQLVELAVRALSPGINDPYTAMACIDRLGVALTNLAERRIPSGYRYDDDNQLRLISDPVTFEGIVETAFHQIRQYGLSSVAVTVRLLETIAIIGAHAQTRTERAALRRQAVMIQRGSEASIPEMEDRSDVEARFQMAMAVLGDG